MMDESCLGSPWLLRVIFPMYYEFAHAESLFWVRRGTRVTPGPCVDGKPTNPDEFYRKRALTPPKVDGSVATTVPRSSNVMLAHEVDMVPPIWPPMLLNCM